MGRLKPYEALPAVLYFKGTIYSLDLSYGAVFAAADALGDLRLSDQLRLNAALDIFVLDPHPEDPELLQAVIDLIRDDEPKQDGPKTMDIIQDWPYICAAFQQAYGIDLYADKSLHIIRFRALLKSIPKNTKLAEIISIRSTPIPPSNKQNQQYIADLTRLKTLYALRGSETSMQEGWAKLFNILSTRAKNG